MILVRSILFASVLLAPVAAAAEEPQQGRLPHVDLAAYGGQLAHAPPLPGSHFFRGAWSSWDDVHGSGPTESPREQALHVLDSSHDHVTVSYDGTNRMRLHRVGERSYQGRIEDPRGGSLDVHASFDEHGQGESLTWSEGTDTKLYGRYLRSFQGRRQAGVNVRPRSRR
jgi:hypothetical protein